MPSQALLHRIWPLPPPDDGGKHVIRIPFDGTEDKSPHRNWDSGPRCWPTAPSAQEVAASKGAPLVIGLARPMGQSRRRDRGFPDGHPRAGANLTYTERIVKFLLWVCGGWRVTHRRAVRIAAHITRVYAPDGAVKFDNHFMGEQVYGQPFTVVSCPPYEVPPSRKGGQPLGRHLDGCRIGFDLGRRT